MLGDSPRLILLEIFAPWQFWSLQHSMKHHPRCDAAYSGSFARQIRLYLTCSLSAM